MEAVLDSLRRIISRWVKTSQPLIGNTSAGSNIINIRTTARFYPGDEVILRRPAKVGETQDKYEKPANFRIASVINNTQVQLNQNVTFDWNASDNAVLIKCVNGQFVQGIYIGDPDNISHYPAITVNGISCESESLTLDSWKDTYNVEIGVFVEDSTQEAGYRFLLQLTKLIKASLTHNIYPLVNDYDVFAITQDINTSSPWVYLTDVSAFCAGNMILLEDPYKTTELRVTAVDIPNERISVDGTNGLVQTFLVADGAVVIRPHRFIFNSYPKSIQYGKIHNKTLLKAAVIQWFGWEEVINPTGGGPWMDTTIK